ncbi:V-type sodium ATP synthase [Neisseria bacilliformis ATCC BAA-1200]|uniref:V-type sodium ATP synthase n=1 Tax=Neisseria bacilliformis ATCC BAA-1200 TaxID=888742 RepID=F2BC81_9NEIS|nr:V-type sodium ATP synthase [Neisseria bacilliformis ATCC BAA-1200]
MSPQGNACGLCRPTNLYLPEIRNRVRGCATHPTKRQRPSENCKTGFSDGL